MLTIPDILNLKDGDPVDSVEATLVSVYERKEFSSKFGPSSVQNAEIKDAAGNKLRLKIWRHKDVSVMKGKAIAIDGKNGGIKFNHERYTGKDGQEKVTPILELDQKAQFHFSDVYHQNKGTQPAAQSAPQNAPQTAIPSNSSQFKGVAGVTVGMAVNNACQSLTAQGLPITGESVYQVASVLIKVAKKLEAGEPYGEEDKPF